MEEDNQNNDTQLNQNKTYKAREITIKLVNGIKVAAKSWGNKDSDIKFLGLHGWLDNASTFDTLAPMLAAEDIHLIAIDFLGHGKTDHCPQEVEPFYLLYVVQVVDTITALGWSSVNIIAHSMGAGVATLVAGSAPDLVKSLIIMDAIGPHSTNISLPDKLADALMDRKKFVTRQPKTYQTIDDCIRKLLINNPTLSEKTVSNIVKRGTIQVEGGYQFCHDPRLLGKEIMSIREDDVIEFLKRIRCPVLLLWAKSTVDKYKGNEQKSTSDIKFKGPAAKYFARRDAQAIRETINAINRRMKSVEHLTTKIIDGGHHVHSDNPERVFPHIINFIKKPQSKL